MQQVGVRNRGQKVLTMPAPETYGGADVQGGIFDQEVTKQFAARTILISCSEVRGLVFVQHEPH